MRPWLVLKAFDVAFEETVIPLYRDDSRAAIARYSDAGKVPESHGSVRLSEWSGA
jgi:glutathione S-transferase